MNEIDAVVCCPEKRTRVRKGRGFSLKELKEAGLTLHDALRYKIPVDRRRESSHPENVETLKKTHQEEGPKPESKRTTETAARKRRRGIAQPSS